MSHIKYAQQLKWELNSSEISLLLSKARKHHLTNFYVSTGRQCHSVIFLSQNILI